MRGLLRPGAGAGRFDPERAPGQLRCRRRLPSEPVEQLLRLNAEPARELQQHVGAREGFAALDLASPMWVGRLLTASRHSRSAANCLRLNDMETLVSAAALLVGLVLLWTWRRGLEVSSFQATLLSAIEVAGFVISVVALGWLGVAIFVAVSVVALVAWSIVLAIKKQSILIRAAVQGPDVTKEEAEEIWQWMTGETSFAAVPPLTRAELIETLAVKARKPQEIKEMAVPIAELSLIFNCDLRWLAPRFDRLLRLYGHEAAEAAEVAATVTASTQLAPITFEEMVEAMLIAGEAGPSGLADTVSGNMQDDQFRENLRATTEVQIRADGADGIRLHGGPMDGWLVLKDAPSLKADWYRTWPPGMAKEHEPGHYKVSDGGTWAEWVPLQAAV